MSSTPPPPPSGTPHELWTAGTAPPDPAAEPGGTSGPPPPPTDTTAATDEVPTTPDATTPDAADETTEVPAPAGSRRGTRFVFIDTETTGLDFRRHELTEVSWIVRFEDGRELTRQFFPHHTTDGADEAALELTHYHERIAPQDKSPASEWLTCFLEDARGAILVGAVPDFDARHLEMAAHKLGLEPTWDHHLLDVETLALPLIAPGPEAPRSLAKTCRALGIPHDPEQAHGALYDAQQAMRAFDAVWAKLAELRTDDAPLPPPVPRDNGRNGRNTAPAPAAQDDTVTETAPTTTPPAAPTTTPPAGPTTTPPAAPSAAPDAPPPGPPGAPTPPPADHESG